MEQLDILKRLKLLSTFGTDSRDIDYYIDPDDLCGSYDRLMRDDELAGDRYAETLRRMPDKQFDGIFNTCRDHGISIVSPEDEAFPKQLTKIDDPPLLLFVMGDISLLNDVYSAAVVGCREPCDYSLAVTRRFSGELASRGVAIVSGFARGIDTAAHNAAIDAGGVTAAVLGCGLLYDYPKRSMPLKKRIAEHGAVISEYFPTQTPAGQNFKVRNRLISGLTDCVLETEASGRSGALNTASHAADQGKDVFVIPPHDLFADRFAGQSELLSEGASLALSPADVYDNIVERHNLYGLCGSIL